jgi:hypothetical protein
MKGDHMKQTITRLAASIIDLAGEIGTEAEAVPDDSGIFGAEAVLHIRDAQQAMNQARDALRLAIMNGNKNGKPVELVFPE